MLEIMEDKDELVIVLRSLCFKRGVLNFFNWGNLFMGREVLYSFKKI